MEQDTPTIPLPLLQASVSMTLGQTKGQTVLPDPPPEAFDEDNILEKERSHLLEATVMLWAKRIDELLATDPIHAFEQQPQPHQQHPQQHTSHASSSSVGGGAGDESGGSSSQHPEPDAEIAFWQNKAADLQFVESQLQSQRTMVMLSHLSKYNNQKASTLQHLATQVQGPLKKKKKKSFPH